MFFIKPKTYQTGFSTLEVMIAMVILILAVTTVILVLFGGQSVTTDAQTNQEAIYMAQKELEIIRAQSRGTVAEFESIISVPATISGDIYAKELIVSPNSPCSNRVISKLNWTMEQRPQSVSVSTVVTSVKAFIANGSNCPSSGPEDPWRNPDTLSYVDFMPAGIKATDVDVVNKIVFMSAIHSAPGSNDFFVIDATASASPVMVSNLNTGPGLNAVAVVKDVNPSSDDYAFVANDDTTGQLQVIKVTDINLPTVVATASLDIHGVNPAGSYPEGRALFYYNAKLYLGLHRTDGPELHIFDVSNPESPVWLGSREVNHNINSIMVQGNYAYLAISDNNREVIILNISNPASVQPPFVFGVPNLWGFDAIGDADGRSLYVLGNRIYLGRERDNSDPEFYILNATNPESLMPQFGSKDFDPPNPAIPPCDGTDCLGPSTAITDIRVSGDLAFLTTDYSIKGFQVWNIANPADIKNYSAYNYSEKATGLDFEDNLIYVSNESNRALRIIFDNP